MTNEELRLFVARQPDTWKFSEWLGDRDSARMWAECERPDWLLWWAGQVVPRQELVLAACDCAELALRFVPANEDRPRLAIDAARRWARGEATVDEVRAARAAAGYASAAYYAGADADYYAADAAAAAAAATVLAAEAAAAAVDAAARAAYAEMCRLIRSRWPECPLPEGVTA